MVSVKQLMPYDNDGVQVISHIYLNKEKMMNSINNTKHLLLSTLSKEHDSHIKATKTITKKRCKKRRCWCFVIVWTVTMCCHS